MLCVANLCFPLLIKSREAPLAGENKTKGEKK